jgi:hypothetical protein
MKWNAFATLMMLASTGFAAAQAGWSTVYGRSRRAPQLRPRLRRLPRATQRRDPATAAPRLPTLASGNAMLWGDDVVKPVRQDHRDRRRPVS